MEALQLVEMVASIEHAPVGPIDQESDHPGDERLLGEDRDTEAYEAALGSVGRNPDNRAS